MFWRGKHDSVFVSINVCIWIPTVPEPVLRCTPPRQLEVFHTVISTQACMRSTDCRPSYTIVWLNTGLTEPLTTRVCWPLTPLSSGKITLQTHHTHSNVLFLWRQVQISSCYIILVLLPTELFIFLQIFVNVCTFTFLQRYLECHVLGEGVQQSLSAKYVAHQWEGTLLLYQQICKAITHTYVQMHNIWFIIIVYISFYMCVCSVTFRARWYEFKC